jgi:hypothetical protein
MESHKGKQKHTHRGREGDREIEREKLNDIIIKELLIISIEKPFFILCLSFPLHTQLYNDFSPLFIQPFDVFQAFHSFQYLFFFLYFSSSSSSS